jgi:hypothetical protein
MYFNQNTVYNIYQQIQININNQILAEPDSFILGSSIDDLVEFYFSNKYFTPIEIDNERTESIEIKKKWEIVAAHSREGPFQNQGDLPYECISVILTVPIKPHPQLEQIKMIEPSSVSYIPEMNWKNDSISIITPIKGYGFDKPDEKIKEDINLLKQAVHTWVNILAVQINEKNIELKSDIKKYIENRKQKIESDNERINSLLKKIDIPLIKKEDEIIKRVQLDTTAIVKRVRPTAALLEDYVIDRQKVLDIIHILDNQGIQFEKTPKTYQNTEEEDLRNVLLVGLNTVFEGKATGETFMAKGKTDIYLNIDKGNILVCECKIWGGKKLYSDTISQLLGYLTWRNNYGIVITFSRIKNLSRELEESVDSIKNHTSYKKGFHRISSRHFLSHHCLPSDDMKYVEIHHLFYNLHIP